MAALTPPGVARWSHHLRGYVAGEDVAFALGPGSHPVGSEPGNRVTLPFEGVSRRHALIQIADERVVVIDNRSKNGTFVNGHPVGRAEVEAGNVLGFGSVELRLEVIDPEDRELAIVLSPWVEMPRPERDPTTESTRTLHRAGGDVEECLCFIGEYVGDLSPEPGCCAPALARLAEELGCDGVFLVGLKRGTETTLLAATGKAEPRKLDGWLEQIGFPGAGTRATGAAGRFVSNARATGFFIPRAGGFLGLVAIGDFEARTRSESLFSTLLSVTLKTLAIEHLGPLSSHAARQCSALRFPAEHVRGRSAAMEEIYHQLEPLATSDLPVLIRGETGVGKEVIARIIHLSSDRPGPFVAINCGAIPPELLEAELFGIGERVATGVAGRRGQFLEADGGTLFLDEIGEMPAGLQVKLLRVLQEKTLRPLGGAPRPIDVRLVSATNAELEPRMGQGAFRRDLYFRLAGCVLHLPPLARRREDLPILIEAFLKRFSTEIGKPIFGLTAGALERLVTRPWPGNVRELEHEIRRLVHLCPGGGTIDTSMVSDSRSRAAGAPPPLPTLDLAELEHMALLEALRRTDGNQVRAAELLGVSRHVVRRRLEQFGES